jgi:hypothetical protein
MLGSDDSPRFLACGQNEIAGYLKERTALPEIKKTLHKRILPYLK